MERGRLGTICHCLQDAGRRWHSARLSASHFARLSKLLSARTSPSVSTTSVPCLPAMPPRVQPKRKAAAKAAAAKAWQPCSCWSLRSLHSLLSVLQNVSIPSELAQEEEEPEVEEEVEEEEEEDAEASGQRARGVNRSECCLRLRRRKMRKSLRSLRKRRHISAGSCSQYSALGAPCSDNTRGDIFRLKRFQPAVLWLPRQLSVSVAPVCHFGMLVVVRVFSVRQSPSAGPFLQGKGQSQSQGQGKGQGEGQGQGEGPFFAVFRLPAAFGTSGPSTLTTNSCCRVEMSFPTHFRIPNPRLDCPNIPKLGLLGPKTFQSHASQPRVGAGGAGSGSSFPEKSNLAGFMRNSSGNHANTQQAIFEPNLKPRDLEHLPRSRY